MQCHLKASVCRSFSQQEMTCDLGNMWIIPCQKWQIQQRLMGKRDISGLCAQNPSNFCLEQCPKFKLDSFCG